MNTNPQNPVAQNTASAIAHMDALASEPRCTHSANSDRQVWHHQWSEDEARAVQIALATRRPLLLRGEPGCGKTQLAKAVAQELGWKYLVEVVHPRMEPQDLIYRFDAVKRLAYAHTEATDDQLDSLAFYEPGVLWKALDWQSAQKAGKRQNNQEADTEKNIPCGTVVCIDEIDKADSDVPNSLLEVFGERQVSLPSPLPSLSWPQESQGNPPAQLPPLIILTTNEDRMLPAPFLRRCVVLTLETQSDHVDWLVTKRGQAHYKSEKNNNNDGRPYLSKGLMEKAADLLVQDRAGFKADQLPLPGVAEYLDLLRALHQLQSELNWSDAQISGRLDQLSRYVYRKHAGADLAEEHQQWAKREGR